MGRVMNFFVCFFAVSLSNNHTVLKRSAPHPDQDGCGDVSGLDGSAKSRTEMSNVEMQVIVAEVSITQINAWFTLLFLIATSGWQKVNLYRFRCEFWKFPCKHFICSLANLPPKCPYRIYIIFWYFLPKFDCFMLSWEAGWSDSDKIIMKSYQLSYLHVKLFIPTNN